MVLMRLTLAALLLAACGSSRQPLSAATLVGRWRESPIMTQTTYEFSSDGRFESIYSGTQKATGTYTVVDDLLTLDGMTEGFTAHGIYTTSAYANDRSLLVRAYLRSAGSGASLDGTWVLTNNSVEINDGKTTRDLKITMTLKLNGGKG